MSFSAFNSSSVLLKAVSLCFLAQNASSSRWDLGFSGFQSLQDTPKWASVPTSMQFCMVMVWKGHIATTSRSWPHGAAKFRTKLMTTRKTLSSICEENTCKISLFQVWPRFENIEHARQPLQKQKLERSREWWAPIAESKQFLLAWKFHSWVKSSSFPRLSALSIVSSLSTKCRREQVQAKSLFIPCRQQENSCSCIWWGPLWGHLCSEHVPESVMAQGKKLESRKRKKNNCQINWISVLQIP